MNIETIVAKLQGSDTEPLTADERQAVVNALLSIPQLAGENQTLMHLAQEYGGALGDIQNAAANARGRIGQAMATAGYEVPSIDLDAYRSNVAEAVRQVREMTDVSQIAGAAIRLGMIAFGA